MHASRSSHALSTIPAEFCGGRERRWDPGGRWDRQQDYRWQVGSTAGLQVAGGIDSRIAGGRWDSRTVAQFAAEAIGAWFDSS